MNLGGRIKIAVARSGMKTPEICRRADVPLQAVHALMRRDSNRSGFAEKLLAVIPDHVINKDWVRTGLGSPDTISPSAPSVVSNVKPITAAPPSQKGTPATTTTAHEFHLGSFADYGVGGAPLRSWEHQDELPIGPWVFIPRLGVMPVPGGVGIDGMKTVLVKDEVQAWRTNWIKDDQLKPSGLGWSVSRDESMSPVIGQGDEYVVDTAQTEVIDGKTYSVFYDGMERPRKLFRLPGGGLKMVANNAAQFTPIDLTAEQVRNVKVLGRVVRHMGNSGL